jgi:hypothetical protein
MKHLQIIATEKGFSILSQVSEGGVKNTSVFKFDTKGSILLNMRISNTGTRNDYGHTLDASKGDDSEFIYTQYLTLIEPLTEMGIRHNKNLKRMKLTFNAEDLIRCISNSVLSPSKMVEFLSLGGNYHRLLKNWDNPNLTKEMKLVNVEFSKVKGRLKMTSGETLGYKMYVWAKAEQDKICNLCGKIRLNTQIKNLFNGLIITDDFHHKLSNVMTEIVKQVVEPNIEYDILTNAEYIEINS